MSRARLAYLGIDRCVALWSGRCLLFNERAGARAERLSFVILIS